ncbi:kynurenine/alpha-aminoadipate aminotransferase [Tieghemostelium lacteum]|uniref:Kynurenine/alpha-aminoadipate aminotransferase n=1 Tax=Tieghemostelium lacteum TaxID=361077 RepID=A0A151ZEV5_TIELA|nr:kynurenine/alpha-aminoadipate aminotransferase [Tieghemostelium lacteum]|eukprot:KYQ92491.1 kynurenine/alpha-aminoadipate aminotransferase [Tieghemostelium lacteum]
MLGLSTNIKYLINCKNDYSENLNHRFKKMEPHPEEVYMTYSKRDGYITFGQGYPSESIFPIQKIVIKLEGIDEDITFTQNELEFSQQYITGPYEALSDLLRKFQIHYHGLSDWKLENRKWDVCVTNGAQQGIAVIFRTMLEEGDTILAEKYTFGGIFLTTLPFNINIVGIETDEYGMIPESVEKVLSNWDSSVKPFPKMFYLIPIAQNPTGAIMNQQRRNDLYQLAIKYKMIILEDDVHYFLQFPKTRESVFTNNGNFRTDNLDLESSFLSMDTEGIVLRVDTFSKILSPGIRFGFITGPKQLVDVFAVETCAMDFHNSTMTLLIMYKLLSIWKFEGFNRHIRFTHLTYMDKRDQMKKLLDKYLDGLIEYKIPQGGMYFWVKLKGVANSWEFYRKYLFPKKICFGVSGYFQSPNESFFSNYLRISFTVGTLDEIEIAFSHLSNSLKEFNQNKN